MRRHGALPMAMLGMLAFTVVCSACEIDLPTVDCSGINQPDMGGLVCAGLNAIAWVGGLLAAIIAILVGLAPPIG